MSLDTSLVIAIQHVMLATSERREIAVFLARWAIFGFVPLFLFALFRFSHRAKHLALEALWAAGIALLVRTALSWLVHRPRPYLSLLAGEKVERLIPVPFNTSFPSGHTAGSFALAAALWAIDPQLGALGVVLACTVAFGRVAVGVHFPSDVVVGALIGIFAYLVVRFCHYELRRRDVSRAASFHHHDT